MDPNAPAKPTEPTGKRPSWMDSEDLHRMEDAARETWIDRPVTRWILGILAGILVVTIVTHSLDWWNFPGEDVPIIKGVHKAP